MTSATLSYADALLNRVGASETVDTEPDQTLLINQWDDEDEVAFLHTFARLHTEEEMRAVRDRNTGAFSYKNSTNEERRRMVETYRCLIDAYKMQFECQQRYWDDSCNDGNDAGLRPLEGLFGRWEDMATQIMEEIKVEAHKLANDTCMCCFTKQTLRMDFCAECGHLQCKNCVIEPDEWYRYCAHCQGIIR
jgi:hypothetical protein